MACDFLLFFLHRGQIYRVFLWTVWTYSHTWDMGLCHYKPHSSVPDSWSLPCQSDEVGICLCQIFILGWWIEHSPVRWSRCSPATPWGLCRTIILRLSFAHLEYIYCLTSEGNLLHWTLFKGARVHEAEYKCTLHFSGFVFLFFISIPFTTVLYSVGLSHKISPKKQNIIVYVTKMWKSSVSVNVSESSFRQ